VDAKLRDAARTARDSAKSFADPLSDDPAKKQTVAKTDAALERAQSEVEAALADAKRTQPAVAAAELSRAAEALDRAAAAEREIARRANEEAKKPQADPQIAAVAKDEQRLAAQVIEETAAAVAKP